MNHAGFPTAARLVAALSLAALGWIGSDFVRPLMPPHTVFGWFNFVNAGLGLLCGWIIIGSRAGRGYGEALTSGLTGVLALIFWGFFVQSFNQMLMQSLQGKYDGPLVALKGVFRNALDYGHYLIDLKLILVLLGGGMLCGLLAEAASKRWS